MLASLFPTTLAFGLPGGTEWIIILAIGLLIFGRRLPEVGRSVGRSIVEFKKGIKGIEDEIEDASTASNRPAELSDRSTDTATPRYESTTADKPASGA